MENSQPVLTILASDGQIPPQPSSEEVKMECQVSNGVGADKLHTIPIKQQ